MQNRTLLKDGGRCMRAPQRLPVPQRLTTRRCSAPFQEPAGFRTPSLQSIQDAADTPEGYVSPMMSLDWMEQPSLYGQGSAAAVDPQLLGECAWFMQHQDAALSSCSTCRGRTTWDWLRCTPAVIKFEGNTTLKNKLTSTYALMHPPLQSLWLTCVV